MDVQSHVVAKAVAHDEIRLEVDPTQTLRVHAGRPLSLRFSFKIYETSADEEHWVFRLRTRIDGGTEQVATKRHEDKRVGKDDKWGFIATEVQVPGPGRHVVQYTIEGEIGTRTWGDAAPPQTVHRVEETGTLILDAA